MEPLTKPRKGRGLWLGSFYVYFNLARSGVWAEDKEEGRERRTSWFEISTIQRADLTALNIHMLPNKFMVGRLNAK